MAQMAISDIKKDLPKVKISFTKYKKNKTRYLVLFDFFEYGIFILPLMFEKSKFQVSL